MKLVKNTYMITKAWNQPTDYANTVCVSTDCHMIWTLSCILSNIAWNMQGLKCHIFLSERWKGHLLRDQKVSLKKIISLLFYVNDKLVGDPGLPFRRGCLCLWNRQEGPAGVGAEFISHGARLRQRLAFFSFPSFFFLSLSLSQPGSRRDGWNPGGRRPLQLIPGFTWHLPEKVSPATWVCLRSGVLENKRVSLHLGGNELPRCSLPARRRSHGVTWAGAPAGSQQWDALVPWDARCCNLQRCSGLCQKLETKYVVIQCLPLKSIVFGKQYVSGLIWCKTYCVFINIHNDRDWNEY